MKYYFLSIFGFWMVCRGSHLITKILGEGLLPSIISKIFVLYDYVFVAILSSWAYCQTIFQVHIMIYALSLRVKLVSLE